MTKHFLLRDSDVTRTSTSSMKSPKQALSAETPFFFPVKMRRTQGLTRSEADGYRGGTIWLQACTQGWGTDRIAVLMGVTVSMGGCVCMGGRGPK